MALIAAAGFTLILWAWEQVYFRPRYRRETLLFTLLGGLLVMGFVWASLASEGWARVLYLLIFAFAHIFEYGYHGVFGRFSTFQDLIIALSPLDAEISGDAIGAYWNWSPFAPMGLYAGLLLLFPVGEMTLLAAGLLLLTLVSVHSLLFWLNRAAYSTLALNAFFRTLFFALWTFATDYRGPREPIRLHIRTHPRRNIIFIVDESIRGDHLSLNDYPRETTPFLTELVAQGLLHNWGVAMSAASCTLMTHHLLLSGVHHLPDRANRVKKNATLFQYAQAMGYRTHFFDAASNTRWSVTRDDLNYINHWWLREIFEVEPRYNIDQEVARQAVETVRDQQGQFLWINKRGLHFHYNKHFPSEAAYWTPVLTGSEFGPQNQRELVNSYDNALRYNLEMFFRCLLSEPQILENTLIVYTSDHGQTLSEQGETWAHCRGSRTEMNVPLFVIGRLDSPPDTGYRATHFNLFATALDLLGVPEDARLHEYAPSLLKTQAADSQPREYYVGHLRGLGETAQHWFD